MLGESVTLVTLGALFPMVTLALSVSEPVLPSLAVTVQATTWEAENDPASVLVSEAVEVAETEDPPTVQANVSEVESASASVAEPVQVSVEVRVGLAGVSEAVVTGARLPSVRLALPLAVPLSASVAVTVQAIVCLEAASELLNESVAPEPIEVAVEVLVHA